MPQLPQYEAPGGQPPSELRPNPAGVEANAQAGYRIGRFFNEQGADISKSVSAGGEAFQQHVASSEIAQLAPILAEHRAQRDMAWNQAISDPSFDPFDPTSRNKVMQSLQSDYDTLQGTVTTKIARDFLRNQLLQDTEHMNTQTMGDISHLAANATLDGLVKTSNINLQNITDNPSALDANLGNIHSTVQGMIEAHGGVMDAAGIEQLHTWEREQSQAYVVRSYQSAYDKATTADQVNAVTAQLRGDQLHAEFLDGKTREALEGESDRRKSEIFQDEQHQAVADTKALHLAGEQDLNALRAESEVDDGHGGVQLVVPQNATQRLNQWREKYRDDPTSSTEADALQSRWETATQNAKDGKNVVTDKPTYEHFYSNWGHYTKADVWRAASGDHPLLDEHDAQALERGASDATHNPKEDAGMAQFNLMASQQRTQFGPVQDPNAIAAYNSWYNTALKAYLGVRSANVDGDPATQASALFDPTNPLNMLRVIPGMAHAAKDITSNGGQWPVQVGPQTGGAPPPLTAQTGAPTTGEVTTETDPAKFLGH